MFLRNGFMQSTFCRGAGLSVPADLLRHPTKLIQQPAPPAPPVAAGAPAPPPQPPTQVVIHPPTQRFSLNSNEYFIVEDRDSVVKFPLDDNGFWVVPFVVNPATGAASPAQSRDTQLPDELKCPFGGRGNFASMNPQPDFDYARPGEHFLGVKDNFYEIDFDYLKDALDRAEAADYDFALRMQGLQNCGINAVWTCADLGFDAYDRSLIMEQFLRGYVGRFLAQVSQKPGRELNPDHVVQEAIQMHDRFCQAWVKEHKRGLAPLVESCAEALVGNFCDGVLKPAIVAGLTRKEISRLLRRDPVLSPQFGLCLHFFMVKLDQDRSGRNSNYKSMYNSFTSNVLSLKTFENFVRSNSRVLVDHVRAIQALPQEQVPFYPLTVDWYHIVTQLNAPRVHYTGVAKRRRTGNAGDTGVAVDGALGPGGLWGA